MRKLFLPAFILLFTLPSFSQRWVDIGFKGSWGPNWLFNKNILDDQEFNNQLSYGYNFGGKIGLNFNDFHEVTFDVLSGQFTQKFKFNVDDTATGASPLFDKSFKYSTLDFALLYRHNKDGRYFEAGPQFSLLKKASGTNSYDATVDGDVKENFVDNYTSFVFGFGGYFIGTENFGITFGARFAYTFTDVISAQGQINHYPANQPYPTYAESHPFTAMLVMEFNWDFAYMAKAKCSNKRKLILF
ncbi:MAG: hypothetical protein ACOZCO_03560 [Bacteroidota bacterium]